MKLVARYANNNDITSILEIIKSSIGTEGLNWNDNYPNRSQVEEDLKLENLYVAEKNGQILGSIVLTSCVDKGYDNLFWKGRNPLVIHRLVVSKNSVRCGIGNFLMKFCEEKAKNLNFDSLRLDTSEHNIRAQNLYTKLSYERRGIIELSGWDENFICFEKLV